MTAAGIPNMRSSNDLPGHHSFGVSVNARERRILPLGLRRRLRHHALPSFHPPESPRALTESNSAPKWPKLRIRRPYPTVPRGSKQVSATSDAPHSTRAYPPRIHTSMPSAHPSFERRARRLDGHASTQSDRRTCRHSSGSRQRLQPWPAVVSVLP